MAALSYANAVAQWKDVVHLFEELEKFANSNSPNWEGLEDAVRANTLGDYAGQVIAQVEALRASINGALTPAAVRAALTPVMLDMARAIDSPSRSFDGIMADLYTYMHDNSESLKSQEITEGTITTGGNTTGASSTESGTGNGTNTGDGGSSLNRVIVDAKGYALETLFVEATEFKCVVDQTTAGGDGRHREVFQVSGQEAARDFLTVGGSGGRATLQCLDESSASPWIRNAGFEQFSGTQPTTGSPSTPSAVTSITGWTLDSTTGVSVDVDTVWRTPNGETAPKSVKIVGVDRTLTQVIDTNTRGKFARNVPYYFQFALYKVSGATGTLTVRVGAQNRAITIASQTNDTWSVYKVPSSLGTGNWYENFAEDLMDIQFSLASLTGTIYIDAIIFGPMTRINGTYWAAVGGTTPYALDDVYTVTDTQSTRGIMQYWTGFRTNLGLSLPSSAATETVTEP